MKKIILILITLFMIAGCNKTEITNPVKEIDSVEALSEKINMAVYDYEGTDKAYALIDGEYDVGEYRFKIDGKEVILRASKAPCSIDISGIYYDSLPLFNSYLDEEMNVYVETSEFFAHRWFGLDGQYVLITKEGDFDYYSFRQISAKFENMTPKTWNSDADYQDYVKMAGGYFNEDVQSVIEIEKDHVLVVVALYKEDGTVVYELPSELHNGVLEFKEPRAYKSVYNPEKEASEISELDIDTSGSVTVTEAYISFENSNIPELKDLILNKIAN